MPGLYSHRAGIQSDHKGAKQRQAHLSVPGRRFAPHEDPGLGKRRDPDRHAENWLRPGPAGQSSAATQSAALSSSARAKLLPAPEATGADLSVVAS